MRRLPFVPDVSPACLDGHFPGRPLIPAVVLLDAAIAAAGVSAPLRIDQAKFMQPCPPGLDLELVVDDRGNSVSVRIESVHGLMASARLQRIVPCDGEA